MKNEQISKVIAAYHKNSIIVINDDGDEGLFVDLETWGKVKREIYAILGGEFDEQEHKEWQARMQLLGY